MTARSLELKLAGSGRPAGQLVEEVESASRREQAFRDSQHRLGISPERRHVEGVDRAEALGPDIEPLELRYLERRPAGGDVLGVASGGELDHLARAVDAKDPAAHQPLADERDGDAVTAADFEEVIVGSDVQHLHRPRLALRRSHASTKRRIPSTARRSPASSKRCGMQFPSAWAGPSSSSDPAAALSA